MLASVMKPRFLEPKLPKQPILEVLTSQPTNPLLMTPKLARNLSLVAFFALFLSCRPLLAAPDAKPPAPPPESTDFSDDAEVIYVEDIPADLPACMAKLDAMLSEKEKAYIRENDPILLHFSLGMWIRNEWGLWCDDEGVIPLVDYFRAHGIQHPDDMSGAILDCYAWHLRGGEVNYEAVLWLRAGNAPLDMDQAPETSEPASAPSPAESPASPSP